MDIAISLASILGAIFIGAISPGPSFVLGARAAMADSRLDDLFAAPHMGTGAEVFSVPCLLGPQAVDPKGPWACSG